MKPDSETLKPVQRKNTEQYLLQELTLVSLSLALLTVGNKLIKFRRTGFLVCLEPVEDCSNHLPDLCFDEAA